MFPYKCIIFREINIPVLKLIAKVKLLFRGSRVCNSSVVADDEVRKVATFTSF